MREWECRKEDRHTLIMIIRERIWGTKNFEMIAKIVAKNAEKIVTNHKWQNTNRLPNICKNIWRKKTNCRKICIFKKITQKSIFLRLKIKAFRGCLGG